MQRVKGACGHFPCEVQVPEIRARMVAAGVAGAGRIERPIVLGVTRVLDVDPPLAGEELAVACVPRGHHAVEHVDAAGDTFHQVFRRAGTHQVPWSFAGESGGRLLGHAVHNLDRLADAQPSYRVAFETNGHGVVRALVTEVLEYAPLDDPELRLSRIGDREPRVV